MAKLRWRGAILLPALALGAAGALWQHTTARMETLLEAWRDARMAEGWVIDHAPPRRGGFPLRAEIDVGPVRLTHPAGAGWAAERATLRLLPSDPEGLRILFGGEQAMWLPGGAWPVAAERLALRVGLRSAETELSAAMLRAQGLSLAGLEGRLDAEGLTARAEALRVAGMPPLDRAELLARIAPPPWMSPLAWQRAGGTLVVERLSVQSGRVTVEAAGRFGLDAALQPEGTGRLAVTEAPEALAALATAGVLPPRLLAPLRAFAVFAARVPPEGGPPRVELPVTLRGQRLSLAGLPLLELPPLDWR